MFERAFEPDDHEVAVTLHNLAAIHHRRGEHTEAEALYRRAVAISDESSGPDIPS